nr:hypothetical protein [Streptomyces hyaluromycini]
MRDAAGGRVCGHNPGSPGGTPVDPAPPEARPEHPVAQGWTGGFLDEEAYQWVRDVDLPTGGEAALPFAAGPDINTTFLAAAARLTVGLSAPEHASAPAFDPKIPGCWLVCLSPVGLDPRPPPPFTPSGERPTGPARYETRTVAYAQELGHNVPPPEAYLRHETGAFLDPWHERPRTAYADTIDTTVPAGPGPGGRRARCKKAAHAPVHALLAQGHSRRTIRQASGPGPQHRAALRARHRPAGHPP